MNSEKSKFYFFAYGSNLQSNRVSELIPNAMFVCLGLLKV